MQDPAYAKTCRTCGERKLLSEFPTRPTGAPNGRTCKSCQAATSRAWRKANRDKQREQGRRKYARQRVERPDWQAQRIAKWRAANPEKTRQMARAHLAVRYAVRTGRLERPDACEQCHSSGIVEAHHDDHSKTLEVRWLCRICHRAADKQLREAA